MSRSGHGEGTIYKRADGRWEGAITLENRRRKRFYGKTRVEVAATLLMSKGIHPRVVSEMLGHSQISITMDLYSHVLPTMQLEAKEAMEASWDHSPKCFAVSLAVKTKTGLRRTPPEACFYIQNGW